MIATKSIIFTVVCLKIDLKIHLGRNLKNVYIFYIFNRFFSHLLNTSCIMHHGEQFTFVYHISWPFHPSRHVSKICFFLFDLHIKQTRERVEIENLSLLSTGSQVMVAFQVSETRPWTKCSYVPLRGSFTSLNKAFPWSKVNIRVAINVIFKRS